MREPFIRVIGAVSINGEPLTQHQRALISALVLHRANGATIDTLVDAMWRDRAPATARKSVQNQVARLRRSFGADLIITRGDRYVLQALTDVDLIDRAVERFEVTPVMRADLRSVTRLLSTWRGEAFADLDDDFDAEAERARLDLVQARLVESLALALLNDRQCATACDEAIVQLTVRTAMHPLHERAWELLVAALHLSGRRTEAMDVCARFDAVLDRLLGTVPSHNFQRLRAAVAADQRLDPTAIFDATGEITVSPILQSA